MLLIITMIHIQCNFALTDAPDIQRMMLLKALNTVTILLNPDLVSLVLPLFMFSISGYRLFPTVPRLSLPFC